MITREQAAEQTDTYQTRCPACGRPTTYTPGEGYGCGCRFEHCAVCDLVSRVTPPPGDPEFIEWCECGDGRVVDDEIATAVQTEAIRAVAARVLRGETEPGPEMGAAATALALAVLRLTED